jgi:HAD superfamily hydrolase (TIGR01509 family)
MGKYKAILFDMDGVLIDSEPLFLDAINRIVVEESQDPITEDENENNLIGTTVNQTWDRLKTLRTLTKSTHEYISRYDSVVKEVLSQRLEPQPGVVDLLKECEARGLPKAVASSALREWVHLKLNSIGLQDYFETILGGDDVINGKPKPDIYLLAAERLGLNANECIAIEDSPVGIRAAVSSGAYTIAVKTYFTRNLDISHADMVLNSLEQFDLDLLA